MSDTLENYVQQFVAGVAGLPGELVRPRWQPEPPNLPTLDVTWAAVGIVQRRPIGIYAWVGHDPNADGGQGLDKMQRHEEMDLLCTFYGPDSDVVASNLHDGCMIWQNKSELRLNGMAFVEITEAIRMPEMIKNQWVDRVDKTIVLRRIILRDYRVRNQLWAGGSIIADPSGYTQSFHAP
jgi:hypothetical protein